MGARILVADDEPGIRDMLTWELGNLGHEVTAVANGADAIEQLRQSEFEVVISDVRMPGLSGLEVLRAIGELSPDTEAIVVTGFAELETAVECVRGGAFDFLQKPFDMNNLLTTVSRALERRQLRTATALYQASQAILSTNDPQRLPSMIVDVTMRIMAADDVSLMLPGADNTLYVAESRGLSPEARNAVIAIGERVAGRVAASREPAVIENGLASDPRFADIPSFKRVRSSIVYPLVAGGRLVALLNINRVGNPRPFRKSDLERASVLASQVLLALENRRLLQSAAMSERLAAIGQLAAGVAHEINNPIACVLANQDFLRDGLEELARRLGLATDTGAGNAAGGRGVGRPAAEIMDDLRQVLADAAEGAASVRNIVRDLRALARSDVEPTEVDVSEAIRSALRIAGAEIRHGVKVVTDLGPGTEVLGSGGRLSQVFINLLVNAAQALGQKSEAGKEILVTSRRKGDRVMVDVSDNGPGISPENLARLFEPFFTTKGAAAGTGLGLSISRDIVRRYGGDLKVASTLGSGATFTVDLSAANPVAVVEEDRVHSGAPSLQASEDARPTRPRVLFIDDEAAILRAYQRAFGRDHDVTLAGGGPQALGILDERRDFHAIVCDLLMPEVNGMELYRRIQETDPDLARAFVFVTGGITQKEVQTFVAGIENRVLEKPLDFEDLRHAVEGCVGRRRTSLSSDPAVRSERGQ